MITLQYVYHSCFLLSVEGVANFVFDFWKCDDTDNDRVAAKRRVPDFFSHLDPNVPLYVMVSHHHKDHFNSGIFRWISMLPDVRFVLSADVRKFALGRSDLRLVNFLRPGESLDDEVVSVRAFGSTDTGNSYALTIRTPDGNLKVFHAGDLNAWLWLDESTEQEIADMQSRFSEIIDEIAAEYGAFHLAMFPVDARQGRGFERGAAEFVRKLRICRFFPMHFELGDSDAEREVLKKEARRFGLFANPAGGEYISLQTSGECWMSASIPVWP